MTQEESRNLTKRIIRNAKSGKEIADAICTHFKEYGSITKASPKYGDALDLLNSPLFGLEPGKSGSQL